ncbi:unnamed protein product [Darwinula stevensoni]|uniref:G-protein coupled receptors family 1 profile domain-containing protein n=1 Tax=Darwinula stevensoni TaxID=69355 RepID=A0A7R9A5E0_9CRUS|nr:unnamed protein product [Darwinula stevensoni]CAG0885133.1 unnamed protein product [Darwinula stevensoni]
MNQNTRRPSGDLSENNLTHFEDYTFSRFKHLEELHLGGNNIEKIGKSAFFNLTLRTLSLRHNNWTEVPWEALKSMQALENLHLDQNELRSLPDDAFDEKAFRGLKHLWLANNVFSSVPRAIRKLTNLHTLNLGGNLITSIHADDFANMTSLIVLELNNNYLEEVPEAIHQLEDLEELTLAGNRISSLEAFAFKGNPSLTFVEVKGNPIVSLHQQAFSQMPKLKRLILSDLPGLTSFPDLNGTSSLEVLKIDRTKLTSIPVHLCRLTPKIISLDLKLNEFEEVPSLDECLRLRLLDLTSNQVRNISGAKFSNLSELHDLHIAFNHISEIPADAFLGLDNLQILDLNNNGIRTIHPDSFLPLVKLEDINLGNNRFPVLPEKGLENVRQLKVHNNAELREFPSVDHFPNVHSLVLSYAYHCCEFLSTDGSGMENGDQVSETWWHPEDGQLDPSLWSLNETDIWPNYQNLTSKFGNLAEELWGNFGGGEITYPSNLPTYAEDYFGDGEKPTLPGAILTKPRPPIKCIPRPGPFLPCRDLFDWWTLRCGVWLVFLMALLGNGTVVAVLIVARSKMDVPRFLVCNLAAADFFMGLYLGFLAVVDAMTLGEFREYAIPWQMSPACQVAGFMGVLSSELSVYTLAVITMERNYAITHAMHLNKRLSLKQAAYIMVIGWTFAVIMAVLPLTGVSDYRKFAVCLPFETSDRLSLGYVVFLLLINGVAFTVLMGCYLKMYCAIRGSQAWNSNDSRIAKRMALLVFTDFICWAPIAFFSLTAAFGLHLVSLEGAKVFTVFFLPLNSCCNPFLYAILTKQFKKDCVLICKAIEESRVTRGIGRCRHSSNFSNRHTPANTGSLGDRNSGQSGPASKDGQPHPHPPSCSCQQGKKGPKRPAIGRHCPSWSRLRILLCHEGEQLVSTTDSNYTYQIAEIQQKTQKHLRNTSVSSDNFSSSRSDSTRQGRGGGNCAAIPLRLLGRRRNSWNHGHGQARRGSQDSNLSSSRNDSSAASNSTATWRISRSSVSSDTSRERDGNNHTAATFQNPRLSSLRQLGTSQEREGSKVVPLGSPGILKQGSLERNKPRLKRQVAIQEENYNPSLKSVSFDSHHHHHHPHLYHHIRHPHPHPHFEDLIESSQESLAEEDEVTTVPIVPRKLSTISSVSQKSQTPTEKPSSVDDAEKPSAKEARPDDKGLPKTRSFEKRKKKGREREPKEKGREKEGQFMKTSKSDNVLYRPQDTEEEERRNRFFRHSFGDISEDDVFLNEDLLVQADSQQSHSLLPSSSHAQSNDEYSLLLPPPEKGTGN